MAYPAGPRLPISELGDSGIVFDFNFIYAGSEQIVENFLKMIKQNENFRFIKCPQKNLRPEGTRENFLTIIVAYSEEDMASAVPVGAVGKKFF